MDENILTVIGIIVTIISITIGIIQLIKKPKSAKESTSITATGGGDAVNGNKTDRDSYGGDHVRKNKYGGDNVHGNKEVHYHDKKEK